LGRGLGKGWADFQVVGSGRGWDLAHSQVDLVVERGWEVG
jgi:hypothetical protein